MRISDDCARCLYDRQVHMTDNEGYLAEIRKLLDERDEEDTSPYMVYKFNRVYKKYFGQKSSYGDLKRIYNDLVLSMENTIRKNIEKSSEPLATAFLYSRVGNYIDFGAMNEVDEDTFLSLFDNLALSNLDVSTYESFKCQCEAAKDFLLVADNCGEIVLDKLFLEQLHKKYPQMNLNVLVRGEEALNDATMEDALYVGMDKYASIYTNGMPIAGTVYRLLPQEVKDLIDNVDVILSKGQGNYESMGNQGRHVFYSFLCKCDLFTNKFNVPRLTGMFVEET